jgi:hypothetical protein
MKDCADGSDEICGPNSPYEFACDDGTLIHVMKVQLCDGIATCPDASDESHCGPLFFECKDSSFFFLNALVCDGHQDCNDGSDEANCSTGNLGQFKCADGSSISAQLVCNTSKDCADGSDEANCSKLPTIFDCRDGTTIPLVKACDGDVDCASGLDEANCGAY